jgi:hypothetical protein
MSIEQAANDTNIDIGTKPAGPPRVMVKPAFGSVYEAELLAEGERFVVRKLDDSERRTVRPSQVWQNGFSSLTR